VGGGKRGGGGGGGGGGLRKVGKWQGKGLGGVVLFMPEVSSNLSD